MPHIYDLICKRRDINLKPNYCQTFSFENKSLSKYSVSVKRLETLYSQFHASFSTVSLYVEKDNTELCFDYYVYIEPSSK